MKVQERYTYEVILGEEVSVRIRAYATPYLATISLDGSMPIASIEGIQFQIKQSRHIARLSCQFLPEAPEHARYEVQVEGGRGSLDSFSITKSLDRVITELLFHGDTGPK